MTKWALLALFGLALAMAGCAETGAPESERAPASEAPTPTAPTHEHAGHAAPQPDREPVAGSDEHEGHGVSGRESQEAHRAPGPVPEGYTEFTLGPAGARGLALTTAPVEQIDFTRSLRTVGVVVLDETRTSRVHSKVSGWIESVAVDFIGKRVRSGEPLLTIYSPEVYAAKLEYITLLEQPSVGPARTQFSAADQATRERLLEAARRRLGLWDVPKAEIERLERTRSARKTFALTAPRTGVVIAKQALAGTFIQPSVELYLISDIRTLWVLADIYAQDIASISLGDPARLSVEGGGPESIPAKVAFIPPTIDEATRTLKVRFEVDNADRRLRPGAFVTVAMDVPLGPGLSVPEDAVIHAGPREVVFVVRGDQIEPREVDLGPNVAGRYRVERGLREGERVATGAQFLLDSESRLRATSAPGGGHAGH